MNQWMNWSWTHFWFKYTHFMWNLYKAKLTLLWSPLSTEKDAAIIKWSLNQLSDCLHWFLYNTPTTIAANRVFSKPEKKSNPPLEGEIAAFANLDKMCFVKYFSVTHEQQSELSFAIVESLFNPIQIYYLLVGLFCITFNLKLWLGIWFSDRCTSGSQRNSD